VGISQNSVDIASNSQNINVLSQNLSVLDNDFRNFQTETRRGIAGAVALSSVPQPAAQGEFSLGIGAGSFQGEQSFAIGVSRWLTPKINGKKVNVVIRGGASSAGSGTSTYGVGVGIGW
jgi:autotransporter adhesin